MKKLPTKDTYFSNIMPQFFQESSQMNKNTYLVKSMFAFYNPNQDQIGFLPHIFSPGQKKHCDIFFLTHKRKCVSLFFQHYKGERKGSKFRQTHSFLNEAGPEKMNSA